MKRRPSDWLKYVKRYIYNGAPMTKLAEKYHFNVSHLKHKVNVYMIYGGKPFTGEQEKQIYTREKLLNFIPVITINDCQMTIFN